MVVLKHGQMEELTTRSDTNALFIVLVLLVLLGSLPTTRCLESLDFGLDSSFAFIVGQSWFLVLECFCFPVLRLFGRLERGVLPNSSIRIGINFFDVLGSNTICKIRGKLLLESDE